MRNYGKKGHMTSRIRRVFVLLIAALLLLTGCSGKTEPPSPEDSARPSATARPSGSVSRPTGSVKDGIKDGGTVNLSVGPYDTLNPLTTNNEDIRVYMGLVCEPLVRIDTLMRPVPALFTSWICSVDFSAWEFTLQNDLNFHDGSRAGASDVVAVIEYIRKNGGNYARNVENIAGCFAKDDYTVQFILNKPDSLFPNQLSIPLLSGKCLADNTAGSAPVGTGMYVFGQKDGDGILLEKNGKYYDRTRVPHIERVRISVYASEYEKYGSDFDFALFYGSNQSAYVFDEDTRMISYQGRNYCYVALNCNATYAVPQQNSDERRDIPNVLSDVNVRKAIDLLVDRKDVLNASISGRGDISLLPAYKGTAYWQNENDNESRSADPEAAKTLLFSAGYIYSEAENCWYASDGTELIIDAIAPADNFELRTVMRCVKSALEAIGITVNLEELSDEMFSRRYTEKQYMLVPVQLSLGSWTDLASVFKTGGSLNFSFYSNRSVDSYFEQLQSLDQPDVISAGYNAIENILFAEVPIIGLYIGNDSIVVRDRVLGVSRTDFCAWDPLACFYQWGIEEERA